MIELLQNNVALIFFALVFILLAIRAPIGVALGLPSVIVAFIAEGQISSIASTANAAIREKYLLTAIPFFILSSVLLTSGGAAQRIVDFAVKSLGHLRGGLGVAGVFSCMQFAALSGSSPATVAAIGPIAIDAMKKANYSKELSAGIVATAGTLGILIPPSIVMVVYAAAAEVSVGRMFIAGVIPGLLAGLSLMVAIWFMVGRMNVQQREKESLYNILKASYHAFFGLFLIVLILVGLYRKPAFFTPTEAAAFAAVYSFFVATVIYRGIGLYKNVPWLYEGEAMAQAAIRGVRQFVTATALMPLQIFHKDARHSLLEASKLALMLMFIIFNALIFSHTLTALEIPFHVTKLVNDMGLEAWSFLLVLNILLLIGGQFMEPSGILLIVTPIVVPVAQTLGIDLIHLGIIMVVNMEIGMITPPVGLNLFVTSAITRLNILQVMRASLPWTMVLLVFLILVTYVPVISTGLPDLLDSL